MSMMGMPFQVLMPVFAKDVLHGGPHTLGFLTAAHGIGALVSAGYFATRRNVAGLGRVTIVACLLFGIGLIVFSLSRQVIFSYISMFAAGSGMMETMTSCNTIIQTVVDDEKRGRIMVFTPWQFSAWPPSEALWRAVSRAKSEPPIRLFWVV